MSCYNNSCYNPYGGYNPCGASCYRTDYNTCCNPCQQPCNQTVVKLPTSLSLSASAAFAAEAGNTVKLSLSGSGLSGNWVGGTVTLQGGGGGTLCCCPCAIETSVAGEAGTISNNNISATPLTINITGSSASATGTLQGQVNGSSITGTVNFPSATVTCCNGIKTVTLANGTISW